MVVDCERFLGSVVRDRDPEQARIGLERFRTLYETELAELRKTDLQTPQVRELSGRKLPVPSAGESPCDGFSNWRNKNAILQKQNGYYLVHIPLMLGDIDADRLEKLADAIEAHGEEGLLP